MANKAAALEELKANDGGAHGGARAAHRVNGRRLRGQELEREVLVRLLVGDLVLLVWSVNSSVD